MCISYEGNVHLASHMQYLLDVSGTLADECAGMCMKEWVGLSVFLWWEGFATVITEMCLQHLHLFF